MLNDCGPGYVGEKIAYDSEKRCKPDYEGQVKRLREQNEKSCRLLDALFDYIGQCSVNGKLAEMIGELTMEIRGLENSIVERTIKAQEQDKD